MNHELVAGLEIHVRLDTSSKIFCGDANRFGLAANESTSAISLAHPGTLPVLNKKVIDFAIKLGLAINGRISSITSFDRKHYFYPDLSKAYQLTQDNQPISKGGFLEWESNGEIKKIRFHHIHLEEDAGKSVHDYNVSLIDYNRAGVPLIEMVTEPDFRSGEEVYQFLAELQRLLRYLGISNADMEKGSMRCDCNVSIRKQGSDVYNERCEIKNLNSKRFARDAVEAEAKRQIALFQTGEEVKRSTLRYDTAKNITYPIRLKEDVSDYRYLPDPDLPPLHISIFKIDEIASKMPLMPKEVKRLLKAEYSLSTYQANLIHDEKSIADFFLHNAKKDLQATNFANFIINNIMPYCIDNDLAIQQYPVPIESIFEILQLVEDNKLSSSSVNKDLLPALLKSPTDSPEKLSISLNLIHSNNDKIIVQLANEIVDQFPQKAIAYKKGKKGLIGFFMGQALRLSPQKVDPNKLKEALIHILEK